MIDKRLFVPLIALVLLYAIGIFAYTHLEGWSVLDSAYFLTVTFTTIGYGDIIPHTQLGKMITMIFCWSGVAVALYTFSVIASIMQQHDEVNRERIGKITDRMTTIPFSKKKD
jgi:voltage-gated potassium channel